MMLNKNNKLLVLGFLATLFICYQLAIKKTFKTYGDYADNRLKMEELRNVPQQLEQLNQKERVLNQQLLEFNVEDISVQSNLLKYLNQETEKNKVKIIDFNSPHLFTDDNGEVETYIFDLQGRYTDMLKVLNALENQGSFGGIVHVNMEKKRNYRTKKTYLQASVFLEQIR